MVDRLGNLEDATPEQLIDKAQHEILVLLGTGENTLQTAFFQVATLAHGTIAGLLPDGTGEYPPLSQIEDGTRQIPVASKNGLLTDRTRKMMERMAHRYGTGNQTDSLKDRFMQAAKTAAALAQHQEKIKQICDRYERDLRSFPLRRSSKDALTSITDEMDGELLAYERLRALDCIKDGVIYKPEEISLESLIFKLLGNEKKPDQKIDDIADTTPPPAHLDTLGRYMWWQSMAALQESRAPAKGPAEERKVAEPASEISTRSGLARWGGEVGMQLPRGFKDSSYITRNRFTPFARPGTELPPALEKLMADQPGENKTLLLPNFADVFSKLEI